jgi:hypothetical protein
LTLTRHLARPARGGAAGVVIVFALLFHIAAKAGFIGIPLALLLFSWFFKYAYILFDHTVRGFDEPPTLDIEMVNPLNEQRPLAQLLIVCLCVFAVIFTQRQAGTPVAAALAVVLLFFLPASAAVLGLEGNILKAAYPVAWFHLVRGLGILYGTVLLAIFAYGVLLTFLRQLDLWPPLEYALIMFATLSVFSCLAGAVYERRDELGLETWVSPERTQRRLDQEQLRRDDAMVHEAYGLMRADSHLKCWQTLTAWLEARGSQPQDYRWLCERTTSWDDPRYVTRLTEESIERLLVLERTGEALEVVDARLKLDPAFRPKGAADTLRLAQLAARGGGMPRVARALLSDFGARFPGDPRTTAAENLKNHLGSSAPTPLG